LGAFYLNCSFDLLRLLSARLANHKADVGVKPGSEEEGGEMAHLFSIWSVLKKLLLQIFILYQSQLSIPAFLFVPGSPAARDV
jgi:hypothetical protein